MLEAVSGKKVRSFSVPYGSSADLTTDLVAHLRRSGYEAVFLAESRANPPCPTGFVLTGLALRLAATAHYFRRLRSCPGSAQ